MNLARLPTRSVLVSGWALMTFPLMFRSIGLGLQNVTFCALGAGRVSPSPEMGSCPFSAKPGSRVAAPEAFSGPETHAPLEVSSRQIVLHPAHWVVPLKFQKG